MPWVAFGVMDYWEQDQRTKLPPGTLDLTIDRTQFKAGDPAAYFTLTLLSEGQEPFMPGSTLFRVETQDGTKIKDKDGKEVDTTFAWPRNQMIADWHTTPASYTWEDWETLARVYPSLCRGPPPGDLIWLRQWDSYVVRWDTTRIPAGIYRVVPYRRAEPDAVPLLPLPMRIIVTLASQVPAT